MLDALHAIRDGQREIADLLAKHYAKSEDYYNEARANIARSIELQRTGLSRFRSVSFVAIPGIVVCIAAIAYLVVRYF